MEPTQTASSPAFKSLPLCNRRRGRAALRNYSTFTGPVPECFALQSPHAHLKGGIILTHTHTHNSGSSAEAAPWVVEKNTAVM